MCSDVAFEVVIMERIPRRSMGRFETARVFCIGIGLLIGPWLGVKLSIDFDTWVTYLLVGVLTAGLCASLIQSNLADSLHVTRVEQPTRRAPPTPFRFILRFLRQPRLRLAWILSFGRAGWWTMFFIYVPIYCVQSGLGAELGGVIVSLASLALLLVPLWGRLARCIGVRLVLGLGFLTTGLSTLAVATIESPWTGLGLLLIAAVCASLLDAVGNALFLRAAHPLERPEMASVFSTYREAAQLIPPGILAGLLGFFSFPVVFVASGCGMAALTWLTRYIPRRF
jgi:ACDE family multidrug resistance protein